LKATFDKTVQFWSWATAHLERMAKWNEALRLEDYFGADATYAGAGLLAGKASIVLVRRLNGDGS
jgi:hypothetical protein